jgi:PAS domain S-box-containing protein
MTGGGDDGPEAWLAVLAALAEPSRVAPLAAASADSLAEARYRTLVEQIPVVTFMASLDGGLGDVYVSPQIEALLGFSQEEWMSSPVLWFRQLHPDDRDVWNREFARGCAVGGPFRADCRFLARTGAVVWVHGEARFIRDAAGAPVALQGVAFDISETKRAEEVVRRALREKELLLQEIHHRVKNNLQLTVSLLRLQAARTADPEARGALRASQGRVHSMALVHEMLYRSTDLARVDFAEYARDLVAHLCHGYNADPARVTARVEMAPVTLAIDDAVPCGLIVAELVSNALKYAFPGDRKGEIGVCMTETATGYRLEVRDDGAGELAALERGGTLGLGLVRTLVDQLEGTLDVVGGGGLTFLVSFPRRSR